jgi:hypothetical protein
LLGIAHAHQQPRFVQPLPLPLRDPLRCCAD